jgi:hypothetical protein
VRLNLSITSEGAPPADFPEVRVFVDATFDL